MVGQDSRIFARGLEDQGALTVKWGSGPVEQCRISYTLPKKEAKAYNPGYLSLQSHCVAGSGTGSETVASGEQRVAGTAQPATVAR